MVIVEQLMEWRMAGENDVLGENLPQCHFVHHKSHVSNFLSYEYQLCHATITHTSSIKGLDVFLIQSYISTALLITYFLKA
jgi:hypothetical protein